MNHSLFLILAITVGISLAEQQSLQNVGSRISQCGGTIDSDSDSLTYPDDGEILKEGEVCVWTIHLETTKNFKFNFSSLDVSSNYDDCRDGGIRIYSLTNLVPSDKLESYTFCDKKPSDDSFYLGENVAVVILYVGSGNSNPGSGFSLSWEGSAFDPMKTKHVSSFSTASNGVIRYPVVGHYEPNLAATWLIKSIAMQEITTSDLSLESLELESCGNPDICTCDALILYEISPLGFLNETQRLCGQISSGLVDGIQSRFIVAFFTDFNTEPSGGGGFEVVYYQPDADTTTTNLPETTTQEPPVISTRCGDDIREFNGSIRYKTEENYSPNERCVWTIRIPYVENIKFTLVSHGLTDTNDGIIVTSFKRDSEGTLFWKSHHLGPLTGDTDAELESNVAVVVFHSNAVNQGSGFVLNFEGVELTVPIYSPQSKDLIDMAISSFYTIIHPNNPGLEYSNNEFTTFLIAPSKYVFDNSSLTHITFRNYGMTSSCSDKIESFVFLPGVRWDYGERFCGSTSSKENMYEDLVIYIFSTDDVDTGAGFSLTILEIPNNSEN